MEIKKIWSVIKSFFHYGKVTLLLQKRQYGPKYEIQAHYQKNLRMQAQHTSPKLMTKVLKWSLRVESSTEVLKTKHLSQILKRSVKSQLIKWSNLRWIFESNTLVDSSREVPKTSHQTKSLRKTLEQVLEASPWQTLSTNIDPRSRATTTPRPL